MKLKKTFIIIFSILVTALLGGTYFSLFANYSRGDRVGTVAKFSQKGVVFKTHEGELITGGMAGNDGGDILSSRWEFSVYPGDGKVEEAIKEAMHEGYRVRLHYEQKYFQFDWRGDTNYFVTKVEKVGN